MNENQESNNQQEVNVMYCRNCGKQIPADSNVCPYCGTKVKKAAEAGQSGDMTSNVMEALSKQEQSKETNSTSAIQTPKKDPVVSMKEAYRKKPKMWISIGVAAVLVIGLIGVAVSNSHKIDLSKYVTVSYGSGVSEGKVFEKFDEDGFKEAVLAKNGITTTSTDFSNVTSQDMAKYTKEATIAGNAEILANSIKVTVDPKKDLTEKDRVNINVDYDASALKKCNIGLSNTKYSKKVSDLPKLKSYDPFEEIEVSFTGISPDLTAKLNKTSDDMGGTYSLSKKDDIAVNENVTVTYKNNEEKLNEQGYTMASTTKDYATDKAAFYVTDVKDISSETLEKMKTAAYNTIKSALITKSDLKDYKSTGDPVYVGTYHEMCKDSPKTSFFGGTTYNITYVIYSVSVGSNTDTKIADTTLYMPVQFVNLSQDTEGKQTYGSKDSNVEIAGSDYYQRTDGTLTSYSTHRGYNSLDRLYKKLIEADQSTFTATGTTGLQLPSSASK
jgi:uncharacterized OB-fold protein